MHSLRTRFSDDIVAEFIPSQQESHRAVILCDGLPSVPSKRKVLDFFARRGFWVFHPRYRGTWESGGQFLAASPEEDIQLVIDALEAGVVRDVWNDVDLPCSFKDIYVIGSSFGGAVALMASRDPRVKKVVALSPVVDWTAPSETEPMDTFPQIVQSAFGDAYRPVPDGWVRLQRGEWCNPVLHKNEMDGEKIMIIHAADDDVVLPGPVQSFAHDVGARMHLLPRGGHLSLSFITRFWQWRRIKHFLGS
ncbi:MAG TPA: alpha/beta fold hydrolase [Candidatus Kapabacteria bacterium]|nr:alpha/beta fold hydrolase [Candidatus Kapabacteria bacterium]